MIVLYIDDGIAISNDYETALTQSKFVRETLLKAGFVPNIEKSNWLPSFLAEWLAIQVDTYRSLLFIPFRRIESLLKSLDSIFTAFPHTSVRKLASVTGKVISMQPVSGNVTRLMTRDLYNTIESRVSWDQELNLSDCDSTVKELYLWKENVKSLNCKKLFVQLVPSIVSYSDASETGCGSLLSVDNTICHKTWKPHESSKSSTRRELIAIHYGLCSFLPILRNKSVFWFSDNQSAVHIA